MVLWIRAATASIIVVLAFTCPGAAQTVPRFDRTSTHDIAECAAADDQPVCILRALANFPTHSPYSTHWRLVGARDVLAALGVAGTGRPGGQYAHIPYASTRMAYGYLDATDAAVAVAILADREGASPEQALAHVRGEIGVEQAVPGSNAGAYCMRLSDIWRAFGSPSERSARPNTPRPSLALARAAVAACDRANAPADSVSPQELAERYAAFGDTEAARRVMTRDTRPAALVRLETALIVADLAAAAELAAAPASGHGERWRPRFERLRLDTMKRASEAGRADVAPRVARAAIYEFLGDETASSSQIIGPALDTLIASGARADARRYLEHLERISRDTMPLRSMSAASAVVRGWAALGDTARARALADAWAPRVAWQYDNGGGCGGERPFCASASVMEMYTRAGSVEQGWRVAPEGPAWMYLSADFAAGRGVQHLDTHLAHAGTERARDQVLLMCTDLANRTPEQLAWSLTCACRLLERTAAGSSASEDDRLRQRRAAATAALNVSERAARLGNAERMDEMLAHALASFAAAQEAPLTPGERSSFLEIAIFQLERGGRL